MNHTPGPWHDSVIGTIEDQPACWQIIGAGGVVGDVQSVNPADARLIAAAPDLLAALKACLPIIDAHRRAALGEGDIAAMAARAAISKATP